MSLVGQHIGSIRIDRPLGEGGMGEVFLGFDEKLERRVAVKTLHSRRRLDGEAKARLLREARLLSKLGHPAICQIYDLVEGDGADYLILELVEGRTLRQFMREKPDPTNLLDLCRQIALGLAAAHHEKIIHRDLKTDNVMVTDSGRVKILDFGVARAVDPELAFGAAREVSHPEDEDELAQIHATAGLTEGRGYGQAAVLSARGEGERGELPAPSTAPTSPAFHTRFGTIVGTLQCMSPEQAMGENLTTASDLFSFGILMQELFTGKPPYPELPMIELLRAVQLGQSAAPVGIDVDLARLIEELKRLEPALRPTANEAASRLQLLLEKPARLARRRRWIAAGISAVVSLLVGLVVVTYLAIEARRARRDSDRRQGQAEDLIGFMLEDLRPKLEKVGRLDLLDAVGDRALEHFEAVPESDLSPVELARRVEALRQVAEVRFAQGALEPARQIAERAHTLAESLARDLPSAEHERIFALTSTTLGSIWSDLDQPAKAYGMFELALAAARRARVLAPEDRAIERLLAATLSDTGVGLKALGRMDEAIARFTESEQILRHRLVEEPAPPASGPAKSGGGAAAGSDLTVSELATTLAWLSSTLEESGKIEPATAARRENLLFLERLARSSDDPVARNDLATGRDFLARLLLFQGQAAEALTHQRQALRTFVELAALDPSNSDWERSAAVAHLNLGWILAELGELPEAAKELEIGSLGLENLRRLNPGHRTWNRMLAVTQYRQAVVALAAGDRATARRRLTTSVDSLSDLAREAPDDATVAVRLAESLTTAAAMAADDRQAVEAEALRRRAESLLAGRSGESANPNFQAVAAQLFLSWGRVEEARPIVERLRRIGYRTNRLDLACRAAGI
ncbi:MAG: serine/threonine-protein kinase [Thermoanaerobaculia bacterium]